MESRTTRLPRAGDGCPDGPPRRLPETTTGASAIRESAERGKQQIVAYGCGSCHVIPGVGQATGLVGPPLTHFAKRAYIAGEVPNNPEFLTQWIAVPQSIEPGTVMPNLGVSYGKARDIARICTP